MDPVLVDVTRGALVESRHRGAVAVMDDDGGVVFQAGDIDAAVFPRSAVKALQALPLVESGAADRLGLTDAEIALACASHNGEPAHVATAEAMLRKAGRDAACLECGAHWPSLQAATLALAGSGGTATALHNNCSGKHAGFICLACDRGDEPAGYVGAEHPTMRQVTAALAEMTGTVLDARNRGIGWLLDPDLSRSRCARWRWPSRASAPAAACRLRAPLRPPASVRRWRPPVHGRPAPGDSTRRSCRRSARGCS